jgi:hypothetical protein
LHLNRINTNPPYRCLGPLKVSSVRYNHAQVRQEYSIRKASVSDWIKTDAFCAEGKAQADIDAQILSARVIKMEVILANILLKEGLSIERTTKLIKDCTGGFINDLAAWNIQVPPFEQAVCRPLWDHVSQFLGSADSLVPTAGARSA